MYLELKSIIYKISLALFLLLILINFCRCSSEKSTNSQNNRNISDLQNPVPKSKTIIIKRQVRPTPSGNANNETQPLTKGNQKQNLLTNNSDKQPNEIKHDKPSNEVMEQGKKEANTDKKKNFTHRKTKSGQELEVVKIEQTKSPDSSTSTKTYLANRHRRHKHHHSNMSSSEKKAVKKYMTDHKYILIEDDYPVQKRRFQLGIFTVVAFSFYVLATILNPILGLVVAGTAALIVGTLMLFSRSCLELCLMGKCLKKRKRAKRGDILTPCL